MARTRQPRTTQTEDLSATLRSAGRARVVGRVLNLSEGGMLVASSDLKVGETASFELAGPDFQFAGLATVAHRTDRAMGRVAELGGSGLPPYLCADRCATAPTGGVRPRGRARPARAAPRGGAHRHPADGRARPRRAEAAIPLSSPSSGASLPRRRQSITSWPRSPIRTAAADRHARLGRDPAAIGRRLASQLGEAGPARSGGTRGAFPVRGLLHLDLRSGVGANVRPAGNHLSRGVVVGDDWCH
jgi:hypothetical protein